MGKLLGEKVSPTTIEEYSTLQCFGKALGVYDQMFQISDSTLLTPEYLKQPMTHLGQDWPIGKITCFAGSHEAAQRSAMLYSLMGTCELHGVNPFDWLKNVLERMPAHPSNKIQELLP
jgi:hypothetical protein